MNRPASHHRDATDHPPWRAHPAVVLVVAVVALLDTVAGAWLLLSDSPWSAAGPDTIWTRAAQHLGHSPAVDTALASLWARAGAFSLFAGISTFVWLWRGLRDRKTLSTLLVTYLVAGLAFAYSDAAYFEDTIYLTAKRVIGGAWVLALVIHFGARAPVHRARDGSA